MGDMLRDLPGYVWGAFVTFVTGTLFTWGKLRISSMQKENAAIKDGMLAMLYSNLVQETHKWVDRNYCPAYGRQTLTRMLEAYQALCRDTSIVGMVQKALDLPLKDPRNEGRRTTDTEIN